MGDQRRTDRAKDQLPAEPVQPKRSRELAGDDEHDTAHADRQLALHDQANAGGADATPEHMFDGVGDQEALWADIQAVLGGTAPAAGLAEKVSRLIRWRREEVKGRLADVAKVATAAELLQIGDLVGAPPPNKLRAALATTPPASAAELRAHVIAMSPEDVVATLDAATLAALRARYPRPGAVVPQIGELAPAIIASVPLVTWFVTATPSINVAQAIMHVPGPALDALARTLNTIGRMGWLWGFHVDDAIAAIGESAVATLAPLSNQPDVAAFLAAKAPKHEAVSRPGAPPGGRAALEALAPATGLDMRALTDAVREARTFEDQETRVLLKPPYHDRITAAADFDELVILTEVMLLLPEEQLAWFLDSKHATPERVRAATASWGDAAVDFAITPKLLGKLQARFPAAAPAELFGSQLADLHLRAVTDAKLRRWVAQHAQPRELLGFVTRQPATAAALWNALIADGIKPDWVYRLGTGEQDHQLRVLALNCPDPRAVSWIRERLLGDTLATEHDPARPKPIDPSATAPTGRRLDDELAAGTSPKELGRRARELSADEAAAVRANPGQLAELLPALEGHWLIDGLFRIEPRLIDVLKFAQLDTPGLPAYIRTRPAAETVAALADQAAALRARFRIAAPFTVLPALREPSVLAAVVTNPEIVRWILETTDAAYAVGQLGHPAVAKATGKAFQRAHVDLLPIDLRLAKDAHAALERIAAAIASDSLADSLRSRYTAPPTKEDEEEAEEEDGGDGGPAPPPIAKGVAPTAAQIQARHDQLEAALEHGELAGALSSVLATATPDAQNVLAVCRARASGAHQLIAKEGYGHLVEKLRATLATSPIAVFPDVPYYAYFHTPQARRWLFEQEPATVLLRELVADDQLLALVAQRLDAIDYGIFKWLDELPTGARWSATERAGMRRMYDHLKQDLPARRLFAARFGSNADDSYTRVELARLWEMLDRLPPAHVEQLSVNGYYEFAKTGSGVAGLYSPGNKSISLEEGLATGKAAHDEYNQHLQLTRDEIKAAYGFDDEAFQARLRSGEILPVEGDATKFTFKPQPVNTFENTVLHEVGHAVDDMLGSSTELAFGLAGWKQYNESDFDRWATDLGGWTRVSAPDQARIRDAWLVWLNSTQGDMWTGLEAFVGDDHPALAAKNAGVGVVDLARQKKPLDAYDTRPQRGQYSIANHKYAHFYQVPERTANSAPSRYSMTAPAEYFAECYAEYYREWKGPTAKVADSKKGGRLPGWVKEWFDQHIDRLAFNPVRK